VNFTADAGAPELDAGLDDAGNASITACNPLTNAGCTGSDVCFPDNSGSFWVCVSTAGATISALCADCSAQTAVCKAGNVCVNYANDAGVAFLSECVRYCCADADCGSGVPTGACNTALGLPDGVGICSQ
jgi:hypothetical protein